MAGTKHSIIANVPTWVTPGGTYVAVIGGSVVGNNLFDAKGDLITATADDTPVRLAVGADGEVLTANSATSTGLDWATPSGIQPTLVDAKGDLIAATAADTVTRLPVGTNGQVLIADSGEAAGLRWGTPAAGATVDIEDEGVAEGAADTIDFTGAGVSVTFAAGKATVDIPSGGGAPSTPDYLVGTADGGLSNEIVVGTSPGGELGGTWASPTVDTVHSGSSHVLSAHGRTQRSAGNLTLNSTTWADVDTGLDITLAAAAGDWVEVGVVSRWGTEAVTGLLDVVSWVSGAPVNSWATDGAVDATGVGVVGWAGWSLVLTNVNGSVPRQLVAGDITAGTVVLRLRYRTTAAVNKTLAASTGSGILIFWARKLT